MMGPDHSGLRRRILIQDLTERQKRQANSAYICSLRTIEGGEARGIRGETSSRTRGSVHPSF